MSDPGELESNSSSSPGAKQSISKRFSAHLHGEVDTKEIGWISVYACFLTGFTSSHSFSACFIWCGFQTGNVAQLGLALARTFNPEPYRTFGFQKADQQALCSLLTFLLGTSLGRLGDKIGPKKRIWLITTALVQSLLGMAAALAAHYSDQAGISTAREEPSWTNALGFTALGFLSATMGIQGIVGKRLASPLNTTIVLTTTWVELINDPSLFSLRFTHSRDIRIAGVAMILLGAFVARAILGSAGSAGSIGVMVAFRLIQMVWWGCIKGSAPKVKA